MLRSRLVLGEESGMLSRRRGAIVNTSSGSGRTTAPLLAEYSAAKAYVERCDRTRLYRYVFSPVVYAL